MEMTEQIEKRYRSLYAIRIRQESIVYPEKLYLESLDATVTERCSLKCKDCSNLMQYYEKPKHLNIEELKTSIDLLLEKTERIGQLRILGGEPFMNRDFVKLVDAYKDEPKIWEIAIYSNATIFPDEEVLGHLKHKKVVMRMSDYGCLSQKLERWAEWCKTENVAYEVSRMKFWQDCGKLEKHDYTPERLKTIYNICECKNLPVILDNYLYNCPYAANAANLRAMDKKDMDNDRLALDRVSKEEIHHFLYERPFLEACRYCNGRNTSMASIEPFVQTAKPLAYEKRGQVENKTCAEDSRGIESAVKVSIVIPVYNAENYLERCLNSLLKQSYKNLEILVIDDGSTDDSLRICTRYEALDSRLVLIQNTHRGVATARNIGIEQATGEYLLFVDADDWVEKDYVESIVKNMQDKDGSMEALLMEHIEVHEDKKYEGKYQYAAIPVEKGVYKDEQMVTIWNRMFAPYGVKKENFVPFIWRIAYVTSRMKSIYQQLDTSIYFAEDTALAMIYLSQCKKVKVTGLMGYYYVYKNDGVNKRYKVNGILLNYEKRYWCLKQAFEQHPYEELLCKRLGEDLKESVLGHALRGQYDIKASHFYYPYYGRLKDKRLIVYGAGDVGRSYRQSILKDDESMLVLWVDKNNANQHLGVSSVDEIKNADYDYIVIAVMDEMLAKEISNNLQVMGVPESKILWSSTKELW